MVWSADKTEDGRCITFDVYTCREGFRKCFKSGSYYHANKSHLSDTAAASRGVRTGRVEAAG